MKKAPPDERLRSLLSQARQDLEEGRISRRDFNRWALMLSLSSGLGLICAEAEALVGTHMRKAVRDRWTPTNAIGAPASRTWHSSATDGSDVFIWGGWTTAETNTGAILDPVVNTWTATTTTGAPSVRYYQSCVWTGSKYIIWGGKKNGGVYYNTGGIYDPVADSWTAVSTTGAPTARVWHHAVWTGSKMIVWGGSTNASNAQKNGGIYDPVTNSWSAIATTNAPQVYSGSYAWTGSQLIVWGGNNGSNPVNTGAIYDAAGNTWTAMSTTGAPSARQNGVCAWTGSKLLVWGGYNGSNALANGCAYDLAGNSWTTMATAGAPSARYLAPSNAPTIWNGSEMFVWGGSDGTTDFTDGARYNPVTNTWKALPTSHIPANPRTLGTAICVGSRFVVWGGASVAGGGNTNTGGIYR